MTALTTLDRKPFGESLKPVEPRGQTYEAASRAHAADRRGADDALAEDEKRLLALLLQASPHAKDDVTVEGMLEVLIARAALFNGERLHSETPDAARPTKPSKSALLDFIRRMDAGTTEKVLEESADLARLLRRERMKRAQILKREAARNDAPSADPALSDDFIRARETEADLPPVIGSILERSASAPWDALHDGHLASRRAAWALGIVRYARAVAPERGRRITAAFAHLGEAMGERGAELSRIASVWTSRRPIVVLPEVNAYTVKLVHDLWLADPGIAAVNAGPNAKGNPFATLGIPFVEDQKGFTKAFLSLSQLPALVEPRLGGFTVTAATGLMRLTRLPKRSRFGKGFALPAWMRTMAEIGLLNRHDNALKLGQRLSPRVRLKFFSLYRELIRVPIEGERFVEGPEAEAVRSGRAALLHAREELLLLIAREEEKAEREMASQAARKKASRKSVDPEGREAA